jgi:hypothetical protein
VNTLGNSLIGMGQGGHGGYSASYGEGGGGGYSSGTFTVRYNDPGWEDPEGGGAGVREPRRPRLPSDAGSMAHATPA